MSSSLDGAALAARSRGVRLALPRGDSVRRGGVAPSRTGNLVRGTGTARNLTESKAFCTTAARAVYRLALSAGHLRRPPPPATSAGHLRRQHRRGIVGTWAHRQSATHAGAKADFKSKFHEKTKNQWDARGSFVTVRP